MSAPALRRGACPTLGAPMETGDGLLARLVPASGRFTLAALSGLAGAAARRGNGILEVTKRGSLQIRGLDPASAAALEADIAAVGIEPRAGLPVETGPLAGLDPAETADARALAAAIGRAAEAWGIAARLGPKVSVVVDGGGVVPLAASQADIRLDAVGEGLWRLALAGTRSGATPLGMVEEDAAPAVVLALLDAVAALGLEARARDLVGTPALTALLADFGVMPCEASPAPARVELPVGAIPLRGGRVALRLALAFGQCEAGALAALADMALDVGADEARPSPGHGLLFLGSPAIVAPLRARAAALGFVPEAGDPRLRVSACAGAPACASGHVATRPLAAALAARLPEGPAAVHVSGCAKRCGEPAAVVQAVGEAGGRLRVGDATFDAADALPAILAALARPRPLPRPGRGP